LPRTGWTLPASICGALEALTRALAVELAPLRVNAAATLAVGRDGSAEDIAAAYLFLMTSGFATGHFHTVDGGAPLL
jgi:NAD(P)-dependent dehydrogenase (short-subunit alcohol dehydrogenase family)